MTSDRSIRSSQLISPYGPGAIVDIGDESLLLTDLGGWPKYLDDIVLTRLSSELGVTSLKAPPYQESFSSNPKYVNTMRFPKWMFCPNCRKMEYWQPKTGTSNEGKPVCNSSRCKQRNLVPMRFVVACENGHLSDVPWDYWAHSKGGSKSDACSKSLYFRTNPAKGSGLESLYIACKNCDGQRDLNDIVSKGALKGVGVSCVGSQPWETWKIGSCDSDVSVLQRGASNLYYPVVRSALDIPLGALSNGKSDLESAIRSHESFNTVKNIYESQGEEAARNIAFLIAEANDCTDEDVMNCLINEPVQESNYNKIPSEALLQKAEWEVLTSNNVESKVNENFSARLISNLNEFDQWGLAAFIERIVLVDKLREVRAFCGFERVKPGGELVRPAGQNSEIKWLPAIEVFGEGIFIKLDSVSFNKWQKDSTSFIDERLFSLLKKYQTSDVEYLPEPSAKVLVLHTLSHLLIRQLSFECGYSSGSLRERLYFDEEQCGVLIYTADSDSEGSLGGLVQQGEPKQMFGTIAAALDTASWCSNDPVCSEMETQGIMGLNKAACHSCSLVSETSCTMNNLILDRKILIGSNQGFGLFSDILEKIKKGV